MEKHGICALVTHTFAGFLPRLRLGENCKLVGYIGAYSTFFHGVTYTLIIPAVVPCVVVEAINLMLITRGTS